MKMNRMGQGAAVCLWLVTGCASTGDRVDISIPSSSSTAAAVQRSATVAKTGQGLKVVVEPFDDARTDRSHLGTRTHFFGSTSHFDIMKGTAGEAVAEAIVQQLKKHGWQASLAGQDGASNPDATISGSIQDLSVTAVSKFRTELDAKSALLVRVTNHSDESWAQERVFSTSGDKVFWFDPSDAEQLVNEVLQANIEKFISDTKVEGQIVSFR